MKYFFKEVGGRVIMTTDLLGFCIQKGLKVSEMTALINGSLSSVHGYTFLKREHI